MAKLKFLFKKISNFSSCTFFSILVIKTLDSELDPRYPDPYPDPQLGKMLDPDLYPDPH